MLSALVLAAVLPLTLPITIDGGDLEQAPFVQCEERERITTLYAAQCAQAAAEVQESRRLIRNTAITGGLVGFAQALDLASTAWADNQYACRDTPPGGICLVEWNTLTPTSVGLIAAKVGITILATGVSYFADRAGRRTWATVLRWLGVAAGVIPAVANIHNGLTVEKARAQ